MNIFNFLEKTLLSWIGGQRYLSIQLDITNSCNLSCKHCYHDDHYNEGNISLHQWQNVLIQYKSLLKKLKLKPDIAICGGEPLLSPHFFPLIKIINSMFPDLKISVLSNGTLIKKNMDRIKKLNLEFQISMESPWHYKHDFIRGEGAFKKSIEGIEALLECKIPIIIQTILSKRSALEIEEMFRFAKALNVDSLAYTRFIPSGEGSNYTKQGLDSSLVKNELENAFKSIIFFSKKYRVHTSTKRPLMHLIDENLGGHNGFGFGGFIVDYKGNMKISSRADISLGNVLNESMSQIYLNHPILKSLRSRNVEVCGSCKYYRQCGGDRNFAYATSGNILSADPGCWII